MTGFFLCSSKFTVLDLIEGSMVCFCMMGGGISITQATRFGKGGPITAIDSLKSLIPLFLNVVLHSLVPSVLQITGVALGILGATVIGLSK
jgi:hypothetical protein